MVSTLQEMQFFYHLAETHVDQPQLVKFHLKVVLLFVALLFEVGPQFALAFLLLGYLGQGVEQLLEITWLLEFLFERISPSSIQCFYLELIHVFEGIHSHEVDGCIGQNQIDSGFIHNHFKSAYFLFRYLGHDDLIFQLLLYFVESSKRCKFWDLRLDDWFLDDFAFWLDSLLSFFLSFLLFWDELLLLSFVFVFSGLKLEFFWRILLKFTRIGRWGRKRGSHGSKFRFGIKPFFIISLHFIISILATLLSLCFFIIILTFLFLVILLLLKIILILGLLNLFLLSFVLKIAALILTSFVVSKFALIVSGAIAILFG